MQANFEIGVFSGNIRSYQLPIAVHDNDNANDIAGMHRVKIMKVERIIINHVKCSSLTKI
jgi:hypothetical protein